MNTMIEHVKITREGPRLTKCELQDKHGRTVAELPITGVDIQQTSQGEGKSKLELHASRVSIYDGRDL